ncbi:SDR family NAD(P)-dependent oxidoreductase [Hyphomicrobium sp. 2TAF46]|uniref:SDR family NAD(P)-dependent oxidoreductase n=1 Tax=Hyphomicrobium sp. 2TAF46 TaxID=3233019 RepID=UPI003F8E88F1
MQQHTAFRHAVITGASSGLGAALAIRLAHNGGNLTLFGRDKARLEQVAADCTQRGARVHTVICDVSDAAGMKKALLQADDMTPVDLIAANAGLGGRDVLAGPNGESTELARNICNVNIHGVFNTIIPLMDSLIKRRNGHIVIISSIMAFQGLPEAPVYSASKAAARIYGQGIRRMLKPHNVHVMVACPGFIDTPMSASLAYPKPFSMSAQDAAERIVQALERQKSEIVFPWQLNFLLRLVNNMPANCADRILAVMKSLAIRRSH